MNRFSIKSLCTSITLLMTSSVFAVATAAGPAIPSHLVTHQWVRGSESGTLTGTVVIPHTAGAAHLVSVASVAIVGEDGAVRRIETNAAGEFSFDDLGTGIYAMTARGKDAFSIVALHVIDADADDADKFPTTIEMPAANLDYTVVNNAIIRYLPPKGVAVASYSMKSANLDALAEKVLGSDFYRVGQVAGGMRGRIYSAGATGGLLPVAAKSNVFISRDGEEVARTVTDAEGRFVVDNLDLGQYSLLAVGPAGLSLVGFELVDPKKASAAMESVNAAREISEKLVVQQSCGCVEEFEIQCAPMPEVIQCVEEVEVAPCCDSEEVIISEEVISEGEIVDGLGAPIPGGGYAGGGGYGGGGSFGGGGGGGFGGGGGLLGLAAAGGIAAAIASDNNNNANDFFGPLPSIATNGGL